MRNSVRLRSALLAILAGCGAVAPAQAEEGALMRAIRADDVAAVKAALVLADANEAQAFGATPLSFAVNLQDPDMVAALLAAGATPNTADIDGVTPLGLACELGNAEIVDQLLDAHADVRTVRPDGTSPLAICARFGPAEAVARMLELGAPANQPDNRGQTPLMWAASKGRIEAMRVLLEAGAEVNRLTNGGFTPLFFAIKSGVVPATKLLVEAGARTDYRGPEKTSAAQLAVYQHNYGAALMMVERGADLAERDRNGNQLLHAAAEGGSVSLIKALLEKGADPNGLTGPSRITWVTEANFGQPPPPVPPTPPLLVAAAHGKIEAMKLIVAAGGKPEFVADNGTNVVLAAAQGRSAAALDYALSLAPDANVADANGATPLHLVIGGGLQPELAAMLQVLVAHGARDDIQNKSGVTAAQMADGGLSEVKSVFRAIYPSDGVTTLAHASVAAAPRSAQD